MAGFDFHSDWYNRKDRYSDALDGLADGVLPGKWGVVQQIIGHWADVPTNERSVLKCGKAALASLSTIMAYNEDRKQIVDEGTDHCKDWLKENGFERAYQVASNSFGNFIIAALNDIPFTKKKIRNSIGDTGDACLFEFEFEKGKLAYFYDSMGNNGKSSENGSDAGTSSFWDGPFTNAENVDDLTVFIRSSTWKQLQTNTALLSASDSIVGHSVKLSSYDDNFDFKSGDDLWNDVKAMSKRCKAFIDKGRSRSILFFGPPGTGKSTMARAIARELKFKVLIIDHEAINQISNSSINRIISMIGPGMVILNDVDRSETSTASLLQALEGRSDNQYLIVLTVNDINKLDPAILRPGRINEVRKIPEPSSGSRKTILNYYIEKFDIKISKAQKKEFIDSSDEFSPADIKEFCETAFAMGPNIAIEELHRIKEQRELYAGDKCEEFNKGTRISSLSNSSIYLKKLD